jgi:hypothetical protein
MAARPEESSAGTPHPIPFSWQILSAGFSKPTGTGKALQMSFSQHAPAADLWADKESENSK